MIDMLKHTLGVPRLLNVAHFFGKSPRFVKTSTPAIENACRELKGFIGSTEDEFLGIGKKLFTFHSRTRAMSDKVTQVASIMGGDSIVEAIAGLENISNQVEEFERVSQRNVKTVEELLRLLQGVNSRLQGFEKTVKNLEMLSIYTKMENGRLGDSGVEFKGLAQDIKTLCQEILNKSQNILARTNEVDGLLTAALSSMGGIERKSRVQAGVITRDAKSSIEDFRERHQHSLSAVQSVQALSLEISQNMEEIVSSMQFHDITRQQIEHVIEALEELLGFMAGGSTTKVKSGNGDRKEVIGHAVEICELQLEHLRHSQKTLVSAIQRIMENLLGVRENIAHMNQEAHSMLSDTESAYQSSLKDTDAKLSALTSVFSNYDAMGSQLAETVNGVAKTVGEMIGFVDEIEEIENKVKLIALNSCVKAARLGEKGAVFDTLSNEIQRLVEDLVDLSRVVTDNLKSMNSTAQDLSSIELQGDNSTPGATSEDGHKNLLDAIRGESERISHLMEEVNTESDRLTGDIQNVVSNVTLHEHAEGTFNNAIENLNEVVSCCKGLLPGADFKREERRIQDLESRYTMESEREVHRAVIHEEMTPPEKNAASSTTGEDETISQEDDEESFGDNVELF